MSTSRIGFIGIGNMGAPMAERLLDAGYDVVVTTRTRAKAVPLLDRGASWVDEPCSMDVDLAITMVGTDSDARDVIMGERGLLEARQPPPVITDCSTVSEPCSAELVLAAAAKGSAVLCAPVAGGPPAVRSGQLSMAVSGEQAAFHRVEGALRTIAPKVTYVGDGTSSRAVKILHNMVVAAMLASLSETVVIADQLGIDRAAYLDFILSSPINSAFFGYKAPLMVSRNFSAAFSAELMVKDVDLGLEINDGRVPVAIARAARDAYARMLASGRGGLDIAALTEQLTEETSRRVEDDAR